MNDEIMEFLVGSSSQAKKELTGQDSEQRRPTPRTRQTPRSQKKFAESFNKVFKDEWICTDDSAREILVVIANLRSRLWQGNQYLRIIRERSPREVQQDGGLIEEDIVLMLDHDLLQHEKMLSRLRQSLAQMAQAQEAMGRRLDDWFRSKLDEDTGADALMEHAVLLYRATAQELYRKQLLGNEVWSSGGSYILEDEEGAELNPRQVAEACLIKWSRKHKDSLLQDRIWSESQLEPLT